MTPRTDPTHRAPEDARARIAAVTSAAVAAGVELARPRCDDRKAVSWLSAHCAALEHVIYPAARRHLPIARTGTAAISTRQLEHELQHLHQKVNGDGRAMQVGLDVIRDRVRRRVDEHLIAHEQLLDDLRDAVPTREWNAMLDRHRRALREGPTRPHPHAPHKGLAERAAFRLTAAADRLMNVLDSQSPPRPPVLCGLPALATPRSPQGLEGTAGPTAAAGA